VEDLSLKAIEKYQLILQKDPKSQIFAPLAEAYLKKGWVEEAFKTVTKGIENHPQLTGGYLVLGKVNIARQDFPSAEEALRRACQISPENIAAHRLLAQIGNLKKDYQSALRYYKKVLFLSPEDSEAIKMTQKLEAISAADYPDEVFQLVRLNASTSSGEATERQGTTAPYSSTKERLLSLFDAFLIRQDLERAQQTLAEIEETFGKSRETEKRSQYLFGKITNSRLAKGEKRLKFLKSLRMSLT